MEAPLTAIVPAAGLGLRAAGPDGLPKQYRLLAGEPLLRHAVRALLADPRIGQVRVAVSAADPRAASALQGLPRTVWRPCGGATRADTVCNALDDALAAGLAPEAWVLVHDAARPGLPADALARLIDTCLHQGRGGLLALPVADTVKRAADAETLPDRDGAAASAPGGAQASTSGRAGMAPPQVAASLTREHLWLAQTPQMFRAGELLAALRASRGDARVTDEASAIELAGGTAPLLVRGDRRNEKLTWPEDMAWYEGQR